MAQLSHDPRDYQREPPILPSLLRWLIGMAAAIVIAWGGWAFLAGTYRAQHCVLLFGHWLSVEQTTNRLFCQ
jgi:hypothetical protein